ncbi:hypothetical protein Goshw_002503 [Gossypium schwendimanii]|uniref:Uncharacterized protein n=1 Tax=Gossypium schwendimanii TaxID=34291 RepID=A0A7J9MYL7_GOSSC|nr:hypothetical protein [Gossypium schwendimanii]
MNLKDGKYQTGKHIVEELQKFPDENLSKKQVQQFLRINARQTQAVKKLKEELQNLPPLQIPSEGKRILQTDKSDKY